MKKTILTGLLIAVVLIFFMACDSGLRYTSMEIVSLPDSVTYPTGYSGSLQFSGGKVLLRTADGHTEMRNMTDYASIDVKNPHSITNADFQIPGVYTVTIVQCEGVSTSFDIIVKDK